MTPVRENVTQYDLQLANSTELHMGSPEPEVNINAFIYIVVVIGFYAISLVVLMIKYVRRENHEAHLQYYYIEFVKREQFRRIGHVIDRRTSHNRGLMMDYPLVAYPDRKYNLTAPLNEKTLGFNLHKTRI